VAPENFDFEKDTNTYFVARQPKTPEEEEFVHEALEDCPVDAIRAEENSQMVNAK
jgi:ferredoxin